MKVNIQNIGMLRNADIIIGGLTVLAGINDSGKSTVGRALYSVFHSEAYYRVHLLPDQMRYILSPLQMIGNDSIYFSVCDELRNAVSQIMEKRAMKDINLVILGKCREILHRRVPDISEELLAGIQKQLERLAEDGFQSTIREKAKKKVFQSEFNYRILNVYAEAPSGSIKLQEKADTYEILFEGDGTVRGLAVDMPPSLAYEDAIYIESPMNLSEATEIYPTAKLSWAYDNHTTDLYKKLLNVSVRQNDIVANAELGEKTEAVRKEIQAVLQGHISYNDTHLLYKKADGQTFGVGTIANGLKAYGLIDRLLELGHLREKVILIVDEPEVHLHPEWQIRFAEILVLLVKTIKIKLLITTHSPYFLQALDIFQQKHGLEECTHYYSAEKDNNVVDIVNVDNDLEKIYRTMAEPILDLRKLRDQLDEGDDT